MKLKRLDYERIPTIRVKLSEPIDGYWDGGKKQVFEFRPELLEDDEGQYVKWGSWEANYWFTAGTGRSWNHAISIAKRMIKNRVGERMASISVEYPEGFLLTGEM